MSDTEKEPEDPSERASKDVPGLKIIDGKTEIWVYVSYLFLAATLVTWALIFMRLGKTSVVCHAAIAPSIGAFTVAIMCWGLVATLFRPPALQRPRVVGYAVLLLVGLINNVPLFAPPLSTESWQSPAAALPLQGEVYVAAGGEDRERNYHATTAAYRWASDFAIAKDGKRFALDGKKNEDYFCFSSPTFAPLGGKVVDIENDVPDNVPGEVSAEFDKVFGNYVLIEADDDTFVFVGHMKLGSLKAKIGDRLTRGQEIGACGNSGRSIEPHVHVHAQNTAFFPYSESLPLRYGPYRVNGEEVALGMPSGESSWNAGDGASITSP